MTIPTTYQGEAQLRRYSDTSTQGQQIVLSLPDRESLAQFIGLEGKRFAVVFVQIGDDEQPVPPEPKPRERLGDLCYRAVQWCNDPEFLRWVASHTDLPRPVTAEKARQWILMSCGVSSRKDLDLNPEAAAAFRRHIVGPYQKWLIARRIVR
jgi:hypothetical protein